MKLAIISDIHGNFHALESVLTDISEQGADKIYCLGDLATIGPQPIEVLKRIEELSIVSIMGNHDLALLDPGKAVELQIAPPLISSLHWCGNMLNQKHLDFINNSKQYFQLYVTSTHRILLYHGSPQCSTDSIMAETPKDSLNKYFSGFDSNILIGGHTHYQLVRQYHECVIINPGSVGASFKGEVLPNSYPSINNWAEYAIIELTDNRFNIDLRQVKYDIDAYLAVLNKSDLPAKDWWISQLSSPGK